MADLAVILILAVILGGAGLYVYRAKKSGRKCIGCPDGGSCGGSATGCSGACAGCSGCCSKDE